MQVKLCPFCNKKSAFRAAGIKSPLFKKVMVIGGGFRENNVCIKCGSKDRDRAVYLFLLQELKLHSEDIFSKKYKILHIAPEKPLEKILNNKGFVYLTADLNRSDVNLNFDLHKIPFPENYFDIIICNHVLEHVKNDVQVLAELKRVLKKDGWALLQVPVAVGRKTEANAFASEKVRIERFGQKDHLRLYGEDYPEILHKAGFRVNIFNFAEVLGEHYADKYGLIKAENIYQCFKP